ncbi:phosphatase PAP2 family protein [Arthrobacter globiformis]|uniref:phosphatase PAP2 family protein n=1 Tax=Arthrobacter globiformis TaxID=1665 RepID=UPI0027D8A16E|nr:phosphatase PAP2 family protein [Arthrobacter globiformis]
MAGTLREVGKTVGRLDRTLVERVSHLPPSSADGAVQGLSWAASYSKLWFAVAGAMALRNGRPRRAAAHGLTALALASGTNAVFKALLPSRPRPEQLSFRRFGPPESGSSSLPSGHSASAAAFATGVALVSPGLGAAVIPVAAGVAYSPVHTGAHWPSDVVLGSTLGIGAALLTKSWRPGLQSCRGAALMHWRQSRPDR